MSSISPSYERATELTESLKGVNESIRAAAESISSEKPILVAVSKRKPVSDIMACFQAGQIDFGENYANELVEKAEQLPQDIRWHFIGTLQSNKVKALAGIVIFHVFPNAYFYILSGVPNLYMVQTLSSAKTAAALDKQLPVSRQTPLNVMLQINTSGEESKSGLPPLHTEGSETEGEESNSLEIYELASYIISHCKRLHILGVMTIGSFEASTDDSAPNPDFECLLRTRDALEEKLQAEAPGTRWGKDGRLLLSMGMSSDFEAAIRAGSNIVRVGTSIFGERSNKLA
ncbi:hypothetical protein FRC17_001540 [Serendipita sp. 399]|nr:hypothetical protein FRC17_001540 [Serendipita sp. 399]